MTQACRLPAVSILPDQDTRLLAAAQDIATLADGLLMMADSPLMAIPVSKARLDTDMPTLWCQRLEPCIERQQYLSETAVFAPVIDALRHAVAAMADRLDAWAWDQADNPDVCVVTDGTGVALFDRCPSADSGPGWLLSLTANAGGASTVIPFDRNGFWSLLQTVSDATRH